jgi:hypothetical protein
MTMECLAGNARRFWMSHYRGRQTDNILGNEKIGTVNNVCGTFLTVYSCYTHMSPYEKKGFLITYLLE